MAQLTVDGTAKTLPADEFQAQKVASYNGALTALEAAWTAWSPTWTNLTVSNGTVTAKFRQIGKLVVCRLHIVFGSSTSISGSVTFTLPVTAITYPGAVGTLLGGCRLFDASVPAAREGIIVTASTTTALIGPLDASSTYLTAQVLSSSVPFTWTTSDEILAQFFYEAA